MLATAVTSGNHTVTVTVSVGLVHRLATAVAAVTDVGEGVGPKLVVITGFHDSIVTKRGHFDVIVADDDSRLARLLLVM